MTTYNQIHEFGKKIGNAFHARKVILFGSYAGGNSTSNSDVDLLVIIDWHDKGWKLANQIRNYLNPTFPLDILIRNPEQIDQRLEMGDPFISEIVNTGKVLYEASDN